MLYIKVLFSLVWEVNLSDPFSDIDNEVTLDKFKSIFNKYKKLIVVTLSFLLVTLGIFFYVNHTKQSKDIRLSGYLIEILSIVDTEEEKAIKELEKLSKLGHEGHEILSNLLLSKIYLKKQDFSGALSY